jgi:hypothetical protein
VTENDKTHDVFTIPDKFQRPQSQPVLSDAITVSGLSSGDDACFAPKNPKFQ